MMTNTVGPEVWVMAQYRLLDAEERLVEESNPEEPLRFLFGMGQIAPAIEAALDGRRVGDRVRVALEPEEAFGERDSEAMLWVDRDEFREPIAVGDELEAESEDGETVYLRVLELEPEMVLLDANHPLAGQRVTLELTVGAIRVATSAEVEEAQDLLDVGALGEEDESELLPIQSLLRRSSLPKSQLS